MIRSEKMILRKTDEIAKWLEDATAIYNQALYHLRQEYFDAQKQNRKTDFSKIDIYKIIKSYDCWNDSTLDYNAKQYVLRKVNDNWKSFFQSNQSILERQVKVLWDAKDSKVLEEWKDCNSCL